MLLQSSFVFGDALSDRLAGFLLINNSEGEFVEIWSADYLDEPLVSKGELKYVRPGKLIKLITYPEQIAQQIIGTVLSIKYNNEVRIIQLTEQPELAAGIYALQAVLDGDEEKLRRLFDLQYSELDASWHLSLKPKDKEMSDSIELINLRGKQNRIRQISVQFFNGDNLLTEITHRD